MRHTVGQGGMGDIPLPGARSGGHPCKRGASPRAAPECAWDVLALGSCVSCKLRAKLAAPRGVLLLSSACAHRGRGVLRASEKAQTRRRKEKVLWRLHDGSFHPTLWPMGTAGGGKKGSHCLHLFLPCSTLAPSQSKKKKFIHTHICLYIYKHTYFAPSAILIQQLRGQGSVGRDGGEAMRRWGRGSAHHRQPTGQNPSPKRQRGGGGREKGRAMPQAGQALKNKQHRGDSKESEFKETQGNEQKGLWSFSFMIFSCLQEIGCRGLGEGMGSFCSITQGRARKLQAEWSMAAQPPHGQGGFGVHSPD